MSVFFKVLEEIEASHFFYPIQIMNIKFLLAFFWVLSVTFSGIARADLTIEINEGRGSSIRIAIPPFSWVGIPPAERFASIIATDLYRSGFFDPIKSSEMLSRPTLGGPLSFYEWRQLDTEFLLLGQVRRQRKQVWVEFVLYDIASQKVIIKRRAPIKNYASFRRAAHQISDVVFAKLTGIPGAFSTHILYVTSRKVSKGQRRFRLIMADADGARPRAILESTQPILSPAWSPDGKQVAYVSFEARRPAIYLHTLRTGRRELLSSFPGLNSAPAWSPDGKHMAIVLSKDGDPDLHIMDMRSRRIRKVAPHFSIDTEPAWMPDGKSLVFTSDRGGTPQLYSLHLRSKRVRRLTFEGKYNARARLFPDGKRLLFVHLNRGRYHIATLNLKTRRIAILSQTSLDESPTISPNGSMLMYATRSTSRHKNRGKSRGILVSLSVNGKAKKDLLFERGDVREPAWSPNISIQIGGSN